MHIRIATAFSEAVQEVLRVEVGLEFQRQSMTMDSQLYQTEDFTVALSLIGSATGTVLYSCQQPLALALATQLLGEPVTALSPLAQSGLAELGNVITGRAIYKLARADTDFKMSPPMLLLGAGTALSTLDVPRLVVHLTSPAGPLSVHLALREASAISLGTGPLPDDDEAPAH